MSKFLQLSIEDITRDWKNIISYAYSETAILAKHENLKTYLKNTLNELLAGKRKCFAIISDSGEYEGIAGVREMSTDQNIEAVKAIILGPIYGFKPTSIEDKTILFDKIRQYKENIKAERIYFYSNIPMAWNVAEKMGMKFVAKVYTD